MSSIVFTRATNTPQSLTGDDLKNLGKTLVESNQLRSSLVAAGVTGPDSLKDDEKFEAYIKFMMPSTGRSREYYESNRDLLISNAKQLQSIYDKGDKKGGTPEKMLVRRTSQAIKIYDRLKQTNIAQENNEIGPLTCFNPECTKTVVKVTKCANCIIAQYCSKECQIKDWPIHKPECKQLLIDSVPQDLIVLTSALIFLFMDPHPSIVTIYPEFCKDGANSSLWKTGILYCWKDGIEKMGSDSLYFENDDHKQELIKIICEITNPYMQKVTENSSLSFTKADTGKYQFDLFRAFAKYAKRSSGK